MYQRGEVWWIKYYVSGGPEYESTGLRCRAERGRKQNETEAGRILNERLGRIATGQPILPRADRIRYPEAAADLRQHYTATGERDTEEAGYRLAHLEAFFTPYRLADIGPNVRYF
jgi:hypothetical protein